MSKCLAGHGAVSPCALMSFPPFAFKSACVLWSFYEVGITDAAGGAKLSTIAGAARVVPA
jgi:hypothetical protein